MDRYYYVDPHSTWREDISHPTISGPKICGGSCQGTNEHGNRWSSNEPASIPFLRSYCYTELAQVIMAFGAGVVLAPWSTSILGFLAFILVFILINGLIWRFHGPYWTACGRGTVILAGILGWIVGHIAIRRDPLNPEVRTDD